MRNEIQHANESELQCLVFGDEESAEYRVAATHVESCLECQARLNRLAGGDDGSNIGSLLNGLSNEPLCRSGTPNEESAVQLPDGLLGAPSHPEMLGRLGRYEVERVIGAGGMGVVLKGFDTELHRPVAIKVLAGHLAHSGAARQRFARESRAAAAVVHEHVVAIHSVETDGKVPYLVMQYVAGESLQARVDREGPLAPAEILRIGIQVAAGLAAAHEQGVVHRDIKPANMLLESGVERVLITDFGLARTVDDASLTNTGIVTGTPQYMSPEQANGQTTDHRTDLFSLGSVLYFVATGHPPFRAERAMGILHRICHDQQRSAWQVNSAIPDELSDLIDRLLEKSPARRFASATAVRDALARLLNSVQQRRPSVHSRVRNWTRRHRRGVIIGLIACAVMTFAAAWQFGGASFRSAAGNPATAGMNANPELDGNARPETAPRGISADLIAEVSANEPVNFAANLKQMNVQLRSLEARQQSKLQFSQPDNWSQELQSMHQRLDRLQPQDSESPYPIPGEMP